MHNIIISNVKENLLSSSEAYNIGFSSVYSVLLSSARGSLGTATTLLPTTAQLNEISIKCVYLISY